MKVLNLKALLGNAGIKQSVLARELNLSPAAVSQIINHDQWPTKSADQIKVKIMGFLRQNGVGEAEMSAAFEAADPTEMPNNDQATGISLEDIMLLKKHRLTQAARRAFNLSRDPFAEVRSQEEVYLTPDARYVREAMRATARHGGFLAVVGESGAGKSTLRRDLAEWIVREHQQIITIEPYVLGMEDNDIKGKTLKSSHIAEAIMAALAPRENVKRSPEAKFRQVHEALRQSYRAGNRHLLVIEEAHGLPIPTLKHLKRFFELEDGFSKLLGIVLVGQTELAEKLDERNPSVREVVQRCELVHLRPLDLELENYLNHRMSLANKTLSDVMDDGAIDALRVKLSGRGNYSVLYPLAVHNVLTAAFNEAAELGIPRLNADLIREV
ncbi:MAG: AAA family ATPase [Marinomonas foliarum]|uniref:AAA family ATPase n=1 Tax=Marinomonas foliarum TaxID=491950 RepID=UPI003F9B3649